MENKIRASVLARARMCDVSTISLLHIHTKKMHPEKRQEGNYLADLSVVGG
jgi:hypothetical protein